MSAPACPHARRQSPWARTLRWLAAEPFRVFFLSGTLWSVIGVSLWPLFYAGKLGFYPSFAHARIMIEAFGGAFVVGFLGTAGPRMASAPKLTAPELLGLFALHQACGLSHLTLRHAWGDGLFVALLGSLLVGLVIRVVRFREDPPPPQMLLALTGLVCGIAGAVMMLLPATMDDPRRFRLAGLLLYQGLLLPPALGIGSFMFPRMLGGDFGEPSTAARRRNPIILSLTTAALLIASFFLEAAGHALSGGGLRAAVAFAYLFFGIRWRPRQAGSLTTGLYWALAMGFLGLALAPFHAAPARVSVEHLLYIGGFGLLMLVVGSRVLFGHSGDLPGFHLLSKWVRFLVVLGVLAALTRATPAWQPGTTVSHHIYAALTWALLAVLWLFWHRRRFITRDEDD